MFSMAKPSPESRNRLYNPKYKTPSSHTSILSTPKLLIYLVPISIALLIIFQSVEIPPSHTWYFMNQHQSSQNCTMQTEFESSMASKLRYSVTYFPLKDLRFSNQPLKDHTWFMSSMHDKHEPGEVQYQEYPSKASQGRILCLKGQDKHDGSWNSYALAWPQALPLNSTLMKGTTFVSYNHYNYDNIWHGLSAIVPFVSWHVKNRCTMFPSRWVLYHWGELRTKMGTWLSLVIKATFGEPLNIEVFDVSGESHDDHAFCFEKAVVMRHNEGGMSRERRLEVYDLLRCKARIYCNVSLKGRISEVNEHGLPIIRLTMFMRTGPRSFKNQSDVIGIFDRACREVEGCQMMVAYANNLTFCQQVKLMSITDILVSPHGAQLTNMFLMDRNSSVMEFFPKGWLNLAGVGQYVYHWIASWSGMTHRGAWRDPGSNDENTCAFPDEDRRCMSIYKSARIGHNLTYFSQWVRIVLDDVRENKAREILSNNGMRVFDSRSCPC